eukprot:s3492_g2.t1
MILYDFKTTSCESSKSINMKHGHLVNFSMIHIHKDSGAGNYCNLCTEDWQDLAGDDSSQLCPSHASAPILTTSGSPPFGVENS